MCSKEPSPTTERTRHGVAAELALEPGRKPVAIVCDGQVNRPGRCHEPRDHPGRARVANDVGKTFFIEERDSHLLPLG